MNTSRTPSHAKRAQRTANSWLAPVFACAATLMGLPVNAAITLPNTPLQTNNGVPPNIRLILDNSGSMEFTAMPADRSRYNFRADAPQLADNIADRSYVNNTIYYDPRITYRTWLKADGTPYTGGTSFTSVFTHPALLMRDNETNEWQGNNVGGGADEDLSATDQTFYVPKVANPGTTNNGNYQRYRFISRTATTNANRIERCDWNSSTSRWTLNCTLATPTGRTEDAEKTNFATWYSYHSTRMKVAKAGIFTAFNDTSIFNADSQYRVGFSTINSPGTYDRRIPVQNGDNGLFRNTARTDWFQSVYDTLPAQGGTPLIAALIRAGQYYEEEGADGPWGPQEGANQFECRQNFSILTTDGFWNSETTAPTATMGNADGSTGTTIKGPPDKPGDPEKSYTYAGTAPYRDDWSNTLADVAMHYWNRDLRTGLTNTVPASTANPAFWQHMVTFGISIGLSGTLDVTDTWRKVRANEAVAWPNPIANTGKERIDDLLHAAVNGRGAFVSASNPEQFSDGLGNALRSISERQSTGSNASVAGTSTRAGVKVFIASYTAGKWFGELESYPVSNAGVGSTRQWAASFPEWTTRKIFTRNATAGATFPTSAQQTVLGADIANYLRGDRSKEEILNRDGTLRNRNSLLGDIINSSPVYVKKQNADGTTAHETVYVGANDGMMHAFDAATGVERFAYVPASLDMTRLREYANPTYGHRFYVDGPLVASSNEHSASQTVLVGSLGRGGRGLYALDVTNPASFGTANVLWEKSGATEANLGQVLGQPFISKLNDGSLALVVGNGINSSSDKAVLLVYNLTTGAKLAEIEVPASGTGDNGLSGPNGWDENGDGTVDYVYAGDLRGNVWKFDLSAANPSRWDVAGNRPLYAPTNSLPQPVTGGVTISFDATSETRWVFFGTGRMLTTSDLTDNSVQTWYGIKDDGSTSSITRSNLTAREIQLAASDPVTKVRRRAFEPNAPLPANSKGWYIDLDMPPSNTREGERMIGEPQVLRDVLIASSVIPNTGNPCMPGRGYINAVDAYTGTSVRVGFFDANFNGNFSDDTLSNGTGTGTFVGSVDLGIGILTDPVCVDGQCIVNGALGPASVPVPQGFFSGRISWREIVRN